MIRSYQHRPRAPENAEAANDLLLVRLPAPAISVLDPDSYSQVETGRGALEMLRVLRFHLLVASLDIPDMTPWEMFARARRTQARLQCVLLDERMTAQDEALARETGAGAFASSDLAICAELIRSCPRITQRPAAVLVPTDKPISSSQSSVRRIPP